MATVHMPMTESAIYSAALLAKATWLAVAEARHVPASYLAALQRPDSLVYPVNGDPLHAEIVNAARSARPVDEGTPAYHLPSVIRWGQTPGAHLSKRGVWYIRVPFRAMTPRSGPSVSPRAQQAMMPRSVYQVARLLRPGERITAGPTQGSARQAPGLQPYQPRTAANVRPGYQHSSVYEGMRRYPQARGRGGQYYTFRTLSQDSPGWNIPARSGLHLAEQVARDVEPHIQRMIDAAVEQDMAAMFS